MSIEEYDAIAATNAFDVDWSGASRSHHGWLRLAAHPLPRGSPWLDRHAASHARV